MGDANVQSREPPRGVTFEEVWATIQETDRKIGKLGNRLGDVIEHIMSPKLHEKFKGLNFVFNRSSRNIEIRDHDQKHLAELDVLLENGEYALAVEVKARLTTEDVKRMEIPRGVADKHNDKRKYLGVVAASYRGPSIYGAIREQMDRLAASPETRGHHIPGEAPAASLAERTAEAFRSGDAFREPVPDDIPASVRLMYGAEILFLPFVLALSLVPRFIFFSLLHFLGAS
jgi:hypothetical protein